jgi:hypothetical protein
MQPAGVRLVSARLVLFRVLDFIVNLRAAMAIRVASRSIPSRK